MEPQRKLLAIDGGGIRGAIAIRVLAKVEQSLRNQFNEPELVLSDYFDFIGGTSTGGIIAAGLACGLSVARIEHFYTKNAHKIFAPNKNWLKRILYSRYDASGIIEELKSEFGADTTLGSDRIKTLLLLVLMNASTASPWPITNNPRAKYNDINLGEKCNLNILLWQLIRATAAAPYFFEPQRITVEENSFWFYDGGLTSLNNPAFKLFQLATHPVYGLNWRVGQDRLLLISIGTGNRPKELRRTGWMDRHLGVVLGGAIRNLFLAGGEEVDILCRSFGRVLAGPSIDNEVGDMAACSPIAGTPLFSYARYNTALTKQSFSRLGLEGKQYQREFQLDDISSVPVCLEIGDAVARQLVDPSHFATFNCLRSPLGDDVPRARVQ